MRSNLITAVVFFISSAIYSQTLNVELEMVDPELTWPWNWDVVSDGERLITVNENGFLNIRENGIWQNIEIDPNENQLEPRSVDVDGNGDIWIATIDHGLWRYSTDNQLSHFTASNSSLPTDNLRVLDIYENYIWISTSDSEGLIRFDINTEESLQFNMANSPQLKTDAILDPYIDTEGTVWIDNRECLSTISPDLVWSSEDFRSVVSGARIHDIDFPSQGVAIISADGAIVRKENDTYETIIESSINDYNAYHIDNKGDQWIHFDVITSNFLMIRRNGIDHIFNRDTIEGIPSQVFKMIEHQDTIMMVGLLGNQIAKATFDFVSSSQEELEYNIKLFPNPAIDIIRIEGLGVQEYSYSIFNIDGKIADSGTITQDAIDVRNLESGHYFLEILSTIKSLRYRKKITVIK